MIIQNYTKKHSISRLRNEIEEFIMEVEASSNESDIRNWITFIRNVWNWHILKPAFPRNNRIGDIDGIIERKGHHLLIECKQPNADLTVGQRRTYNSLLEDGNKTLIILYGSRNKPIGMRIIYENGYDTGKKPVNLNRVIQECKSWYMHANENPLPPKLNNYREYGNCLSLADLILVDSRNGKEFMGSAIQILNGASSFSGDRLVVPMNSNPYTEDLA